ncbi:MAG: IS1182 family transposase [Acidimicrobiales bacterium]
MRVLVGESGGVALGSVSGQARFENPRAVLGDRLGGLYLFLADEGDRLFGEGYFADLYTRSRLGRPTVPARVLATAMVLQAFEGLSDREAVDRLGRDLAWQAAAGVDVGYASFHSTVLVGVRARLRVSARPKRFLEDTRVMARESGVMRDRVRVLDSTPIYDAVTTEDTITQLRSAIRKTLAALRSDYPPLAVAAKAACRRDDDYLSAGRPCCDWDDREAKELLVDALVRDALAVLAVLDGEVLDGAARDAAELLAVVAGQDVAEGDGRFRIVRGVARGRVISTVDPDARHGHKSRNRRFDGYKGHVSVDPDSEIIDDVTVTPANVADQDAAEDLFDPCAELDDKPEVMGDSAYSGAELRERLEEAGFDVTAKVPPASNRDGLFTKDDFTIDLHADTVWCPADFDTPIQWRADGTGTAAFGDLCSRCPLRARCTTAAAGRAIAIGRHEARMQQAKAAQADPDWQAAYRATRPKVERKIGHLTRRAHGGRKARCRGVARVLADFVTRAAAINLARLATLGLRHDTTGWATPGA